jgi:hypothetical protein
MITTIYLLIGLTSFMGQGIDANIVNVYPTHEECEQGLYAEKIHTANLPHCCGGDRTYRCIAWGGENLLPHSGAYWDKPNRPAEENN